MAEIFEFQKPDPPFDKKEASKVFCVLFVCLSPEFWQGIENQEVVL